MKTFFDWLPGKFVFKSADDLEGMMMVFYRSIEQDSVTRVHLYIWTVYGKVMVGVSADVHGVNTHNTASIKEFVTDEKIRSFIYIVNSMQGQPLNAARVIKLEEAVDREIVTRRLIS